MGTAASPIAARSRGSLIRFVRVGEEPGEREHEQQLPELGRLEPEEPELDPALRASVDLADAKTSSSSPTIAP